MVEFVRIESRVDDRVHFLVELNEVVVFGISLENFLSFFGAMLGQELVQVKDVEVEGLLLVKIGQGVLE